MITGTGVGYGRRRFASAGIAVMRIGKNPAAMIRSYCRIENPVLEVLQ